MRRGEQGDSNEKQPPSARAAETPAEALSSLRRQQLANCSAHSSTALRVRSPHVLTFTLTKLWLVEEFEPCVRRWGGKHLAMWRVGAKHAAKQAAGRKVGVLPQTHTRKKALSQACRRLAHY